MPTDAIHMIPGAVRNTADEVREISKMLSEIGGERVIIVSSKFHTRRVRTLWRRLAGNAAGVIIQPATRDPYDGARWWRRSNDIAYVAKELLGLVNAWMGSRVEPKVAAESSLTKARDTVLGSGRFRQLDLGTLRMPTVQNDRAPDGLRDVHVLEAS